MGTNAGTISQSEFESRLRELDIELSQLPASNDPIRQRILRICADLRAMYTAVLEQNIEFDLGLSEGLRDIKEGNVLGRFQTVEETMRALRSQPPE